MSERSISATPDLAPPGFGAGRFRRSDSADDRERGGRRAASLGRGGRGRDELVLAGREGAVVEAAREAEGVRARDAGAGEAAGERHEPCALLRRAVLPRELGAGPV